MLLMRGKPNHPHLQKHQIKTTAIFLPIMCSTDVGAAIPAHRLHRRRPSEETSSPKVGCMGQVKRTSKVVAFPSSALFLKQSDPLQNCSKSSHNNTAVKHHNLKRFFSPKSLASGPTTTAGGTHKGKRVTADSNRVRSGTGARGQYGQKLVCRNEKTDKGSLVNLEELDPPLPVVRKISAPAKEEEEKSLWKRRSGGAPLRSLQVKVVHQNHTSFLPAANTA